MLSIDTIEKEFELLREQEGRNGNEKLYPHYKLPDGTFVSKREVCNAIKLLTRFSQGHSPVHLTDEELFANGNKLDAIQRFREKHNITSILEAKQAIEHLRGEPVI